MCRVCDVLAPHLLERFPPSDYPHLYLTHYSSLVDLRAREVDEKAVVYLSDYTEHAESAPGQKWCRAVKLQFMGHASLALQLNEGYGEGYFVPRLTRGDGNCLLHAVSRAIWGIELYHRFLRQRLITELENNRDWYIALLDMSHPGVGEAEFTRALARARTDHAELTLLHVVALAHALHRPILLMASSEHMASHGSGYNGVCGTFTPFRSLLQPYLQEAPPALPDRKGVQKPPLEVRHAARVAVMRLSYLLHLRHPASAISDLLNVVASVLDERLDRDADSAGGGGDGGAPAVLWAATEPPTLSLNPGSPCDLALQCECGLELAQLPELLHLFEFSGIARLGPDGEPMPLRRPRELAERNSAMGGVGGAEWDPLEPEALRAASADVQFVLRPGWEPMAAAVAAELRLAASKVGSEPTSWSKVRPVVIAWSSSARNHFVALQGILGSSAPRFSPVPSPALAHEPTLRLAYLRYAFGLMRISRGELVHTISLLSPRVAAGAAEASGDADGAAGSADVFSGYAPPPSRLARACFDFMQDKGPVLSSVSRSGSGSPTPHAQKTGPAGAADSGEVDGADSTSSPTTEGVTPAAEAAGDTAVPCASADDAAAVDAAVETAAPSTAAATTATAADAGGLTPLQDVESGWSEVDPSWEQLREACFEDRVVDPFSLEGFVEHFLPADCWRAENVEDIDDFVAQTYVVLRGMYPKEVAVAMQQLRQEAVTAAYLSAQLARVGMAPAPRDKAGGQEVASPQRDDVGGLPRFSGWHTGMRDDVMEAEERKTGAASAAAAPAPDEVEERKGAGAGGAVGEEEGPGFGAGAGPGRSPGEPSGDDPVTVLLPVGGGKAVMFQTTRSVARYLEARLSGGGDADTPSPRATADGPSSMMLGDDDEFGRSVEFEQDGGAVGAGSTSAASAGEPAPTKLAAARELAAPHPAAPGGGVASSPPPSQGGSEEAETGPGGGGGGEGMSAADMAALMSMFSQK